MGERKDHKGFYSLILGFDPYHWAKWVIPFNLLASKNLPLCFLPLFVSTMCQCSKIRVMPYQRTGYGLFRLCLINVCVMPYPGYA
jgi:hypothetical protein